MKAVISFILTALLVVSLSACGCSNSMVSENTTPDTTILPDILPTMDTNIPDPEIDTQMPIYTEGTDSTSGTDDTIPTMPQDRRHK